MGGRPAAEARFVRQTLTEPCWSSGGRACLVAIAAAGRLAPGGTSTVALGVVRPDGAATGPPAVGVGAVGVAALGALHRSAALPNQRLQRTGARGSMVGWLVSATEVVQVLCAWPAGRPPLRRDSLGGIVASDTLPTSAGSLLAGAREFAATLAILVSSGRSAPIRGTAFIAAHCVELALKSFLRAHGRSDEELRKVGHSLTTAWAEAVSAGLPLDRQPPSWCLLLESMHDVPYVLRYPPRNSGLVAPNPVELKTRVNDLINLVANAPHAA